MKPNCSGHVTAARAAGSHRIKIFFYVTILLNQAIRGTKGYVQGHSGGGGGGGGTAIYGLYRYMPR